MTLVDDIDCLNSCPEPVKEAPGKRKKEMAKQKQLLKQETKSGRHRTNYVFQSLCWKPELQ